MDLATGQEGGALGAAKYLHTHSEITFDPEEIALNSTLVDILRVNWLRILGSLCFAKTQEPLKFADIGGEVGDYGSFHFWLSIGFLGNASFSCNGFCDWVDGLDVSFEAPAYLAGDRLYYNGPPRPNEPPWRPGGGYLVARTIMYNVKGEFAINYDRSRRDELTSLGSVTKHVINSLAIELYAKFGGDLLGYLSMFPGTISDETSTHPALRKTATEIRLVENIQDIASNGLEGYLDHSEYSSRRTSF